MRDSSYPKQKRIISKAIKLLIACSIVLYGGRLFIQKANLPGSTIERITVQGVTGAKELMVLGKLNSFKGQKLSQINTKAARDSLSAFAWIKNIKVIPVYPARLVIKIAQAHEKAYVLWDNIWFGTDYEGHCFRLEGIKESLPIITGIAPYLINQNSKPEINPLFARIIYQLKEIEEHSPNWIDHISELHFNADEDILLIWDNPVLVFHLGNQPIQNYLPIISALWQSYQERPKKHPAEFDLRYTGTVVEVPLKINSPINRIKTSLAYSQGG